MDTSWKGGYRESISIAEKQMSRPLKKSEISNYWFKRTWEEIIADPGAYAELLIKKIRIIMNGYEIPNNQTMYQVRNHAPIIWPLMFNTGLFFPYGLLVPLALIGLIISFRNWRSMLILYLAIFSYMTSLIAFFVCARFRQPIIPIMILLAVWGAYQVFHYLKKRRWKQLIIYLILIIVLIIESNHSLISFGSSQEESVEYYSLGNLYKEKTEFAKAIHYYKLALKVDSMNFDALNNLGTTYDAIGDYNNAINYLYKAISIYPSAYRPYLNLANIYRKRKEHGKNLNILLMAQKNAPYSEFVYFELGYYHFRMGNLEEARKTLEECLQLNSENEIAQKLYNDILNNLKNKK